MRNQHVLRSPDPDGGGGGAAPAPAPAAPAPAPAAPAPAPATPAPSPAAPAPSPAAPAPAPAASPAPSAAPAPAADTKGIWPENWRETVSKEDAKKLGQLKRYASPEAMADALFAAQERIRSGELKPALAKNATAEQLKEWRDAHGIPESAEKYDLGDVKVDPSEKPMMDAVIKSLHAANATPDVVKATVQTWNTIKKTAMDNQAAADQATQQASEDALRAEWGTEFRRNINIVHGLLDGAANPGLKDKLLGGRLADGTPIGSSPDILKMLVGLALIQNPAGVVVPNGSGNVEATVEAEIDTIEKRMRTDRAGYNKDDKQQARYRELLDAREKMKPRK